MNRAAVIHRSFGPHAYPFDTDHLRVMLQAGRGDLTAVECVHGDFYTDSQSDTTVALQNAGSDLEYDYWVGTLHAPKHRPRYHFKLYRGQEMLWLGERGFATERDTTPFRYSYLNSADQFRLPGWLPGTVFYQVFPDRFQRSNPDVEPAGAVAWDSEPTWYTRMGGDLKGIEQRLDWLQQLNVGAIYLTPVFDSPSCHRYDTRDYYQVEQMLGTADDLKSLVDSAHSCGMRLILDGVFNHCGNEFFAFQDVLARGKSSPYWHWFTVRGDHVTVGPGRQCNYETFADNVMEMPKLMTQHADVREYLLGVAEHWLRRVGADGWRLDVANEVDHVFWRQFRQGVRAVNPEAFILGEVWVDALSWLLGDQYDSVMHYPWKEAVVALLTGKLDLAAFDAQLTRLRFAYPGFVTGGLLHLLDSHDVPRIIWLLDGDRAAARQAAVLLLTAQGVPLVYYGQEVGMTGGWDPENRACMAWDPA